MPQARKINPQYVAFLRGINVGGHAAIKMADLKATFEKLGFSGVKTVLASGNVIFKSERSDQKAFIKEIESGLKKAFNMSVSVVLRGLDDLEKLKLSEPFKGVGNTPGIQLYVTFLSEGGRMPSIPIPFATPDRGFRILRATASEVFSVVDLEKGMGTPEAMAILEREFGSNLTTRNWNTVLKIVP